MSPRDRFSLVGHADMAFMNPLGEDELVTLLEPIGLEPRARTLDLGGGRGDLSRLLSTRWGCIAVSVDSSPAASDLARERTRGLSVEVHTLRAEDYLATHRPRDLSLVSVLGAMHAFGPGLPGYQRADRQLAPLTSHILFADVVALGRRGARAFEVATAAELDRTYAERVVSSVSLSPERVAAYERAWCASLAGYLAAHPGDPREDWARERLAWSESPKLRAARAELGFRAFVLRTDA